MFYADNYCSYTEDADPHVYTFTGPCIRTREMQTVTIPASELYAYRQGKLIQVAMPSVSKTDREFLVSGMSVKAWNQMFGGEHDQN